MVTGRSGDLPAGIRTGHGGEDNGGRQDDRRSPRPGTDQRRPLFSLINPYKHHETITYERPAGWPRHADYGAGLRKGRNKWWS